MILLRALLVVSLATAYWLGIRWTIALTAPLPISAWATSLGFSSVAASYTYFAVSHTLAVLLVAAPLGAIVSWSFPSRYLAYGAVVAVPVAAQTAYEFFLVAVQDPISGVRLVFWVTDVAKLGLAIPIVAWLFVRYLPHNNRMQRTREESSA